MHFFHELRLRFSVACVSSVDNIYFSAAMVPAAKIEISGLSFLVNFGTFFGLENINTYKIAPRYVAQISHKRQESSHSLQYYE